MKKKPTSRNGSARGNARNRPIYQSRSEVPHPTTATLCHNLMKELGLSARAMAHKLHIHHSTFQAYLQGRHRPAPHIRRRLARLAGVATFDTLLDQQMVKHYGSFYSTVRANQQQESAAAKKQEQKTFPLLGTSEIRYAKAKLSTQKANLERQRQRAAALLEAQRLYHQDDLLAARIAQVQLDHAQRTLTFLENNDSQPHIIDHQRQEVARHESIHRSLQLRVDTISNTATLFSQLALAELDAKIKLRKEFLDQLDNTFFDP